jgi:histone H3/H4
VSKVICAWWQIKKYMNKYMDTKKLLPTKDFQYSTEAKDYINQLLSSLLTKINSITIGERIVEDIDKILPEYIATGAKWEIQNSIRHNKPFLSIDKLLKQKKVSTQSKRNLSYLLEYLVREILDLAINCCRDQKKKRITKQHVEYVLRNDAEFPMIFGLKPWH